MLIFEINSRKCLCGVFLFKIEPSKCIKDYGRNNFAFILSLNSVNANDTRAITIRHQQYFDKKQNNLNVLVWFIIKNRLLLILIFFNNMHDSLLFGTNYSSSGSQKAYKIYVDIECGIEINCKNKIKTTAYEKKTFSYLILQP